ncbi:uncharacterized protein LOC143288729 [Babylonia areolata]|uniref:uncharacterized protein LOC143288729 n=1 Tax=Babylonia areolata TaxID=304850 RepID=UPI003FD08628
MEHLGIEWNPPKFRILGIWFTNDLQNCANMNYSEKLADVIQLFRVWIRRQITPLGRIAVLKSLILSKLTHLWILLPNPPDNFFRILQNHCYSFVWNKKNDKINRKTAHKSIRNGGLGLPELKTYASSLKLTWIRKVGKTHHKWKNIAMANFPVLNDIHKYGPEITLSFAQTNIFWTDVFNAYKEFFYKIDCNTSAELLAEPVFYNRRIQIGKTFIRGKTWIDKGICCIAHFLLENGHFISYEEFKRKYNVDINFLTFAGHISAKLMSICKGSKLYYDILIDNGVHPQCCSKWDEKLNIVHDWRKCFLYICKIPDVKLKWFQIRIVHRCLGTNVILKEMGVLNNDLCSFCNTMKDSIRHMFWQCTTIQRFWQELMDLKESGGGPHQGPVLVQGRPVLTPMSPPTPAWQLGARAMPRPHEEHMSIYSCSWRRLKPNAARMSITELNEHFCSGVVRGRSQGCSHGADMCLQNTATTPGGNRDCDRADSDTELTTDAGKAEAFADTCRMSTVENLPEDVHELRKAPSLRVSRAASSGSQLIATSQVTIGPTGPRNGLPLGMLVIGLLK